MERRDILSAISGTVASIGAATFLAGLTQASNSSSREGLFATGTVVMTLGFLGWFCLYIFWKAQPEPLRTFKRPLQVPAPIRASKPFLHKDMTPKKLFELTANMTEIQSKGLMAPYIGKWMPITGKVRNVSKGYGDKLSISVDIGKEGDFHFINLEFKNNHETVSTLSVGHEITAIGEIEEINQISLRLSSCQLIELE